MATKKEKEIIMKTRKPGLPVNISKPSIQSPNAMGKSGTTLENVNVRPTRWQTAKHDASYFTRSVLEGAKQGLKSKNVLSKVSGAILGASIPLTAPASTVGSIFNVISGQARYNKNKRAGLERGEEGFKVRNSSIPLAPTEFND